MFKMTGLFFRISMNKKETKNYDGDENETKV